MKQEDKKYYCSGYAVVFESLFENLGVISSSISKCCKHKVKSCGGYIWEYSNK